MKNIQSSLIYILQAMELVFLSSPTSLELYVYEGLFKKIVEKYNYAVEAEALLILYAPKYYESLTLRHNSK